MHFYPAMEASDRELPQTLKYCVILGPTHLPQVPRLEIAFHLLEYCFIKSY